MPKRIYVGNLPFDVERRDLEGHFKGKAGMTPSVAEVKRHRPTQAAVAVLGVEGDAEAIASAIDGSSFGDKTLVASTDRSIVIHHAEQDFEV